MFAQLKELMEAQKEDSTHAQEQLDKALDRAEKDIEILLPKYAQDIHERDIEALLDSRAKDAITKAASEGFEAMIRGTEQLHDRVLAELKEDIFTWIDAYNKNPTSDMQDDAKAIANAIETCDVWPEVISQTIETWADTNTLPPFMGVLRQHASLEYVWRVMSKEFASLPLDIANDWLVLVEKDHEEKRKKLYSGVTKNFQEQVHLHLKDACEQTLLAWVTFGKEQQKSLHEKLLSMSVPCNYNSFPMFRVIEQAFETGNKPHVSSAWPWKNDENKQAFLDKLFEQLDRFRAFNPKGFDQAYGFLGEPQIRDKQKWDEFLEKTHPSKSNTGNVGFARPHGPPGLDKLKTLCGQARYHNAVAYPFFQRCFEILDNDVSLKFEEKPNTFFVSHGLKYFNDLAVQDLAKNPAPPSAPRKM